MARIATYLTLIRPKQWVKNLFVFGPLVFAKELFLPDAVMSAVGAFIAFCLAASAVYIINDIADVEADRAHPQKRLRPLAARTMSFTEAYGLLAVVLAALGFTVYQQDLRFIMVISAYFVLNIAYSFALKEIVLLDVFVIASGFMLRVIGGAYAIRVPTSTWLVLCTLFISLFLGFAKRRTELMQVEDFAERKVLKKYRFGFLDQMLTISAAGTVISYALYTVAPRTLQVFGTDKLIYTTVFVLYGIFRYLYLIHTTATTDKPTDVVVSDPPILVTALMWICACILLIYLGL